MRPRSRYGPRAMEGLPVLDVDLKGEPIHRLFGENNLKVRLRSHLDVAARRYSDIVSL